MFYQRLLLVFSCLLTFGCAHQTGGVAASTMPLSPGSYQELGEVRGVDCVYHLLGLIPMGSGNETKDAVDDALSEIEGTNALINVTSDTYFQYYILFSDACTQVHGTAVRTSG